MPRFDTAANALATLPFALALLLVSPAAAITGVCPDGSIFVVKTRSQVPCRSAKLVESEDVPPIHPELLPRPYGWERFNRETDPNNPYNVIDAARPGADTPPPAPTPAPSLPAPTPQVSPQPQLAVAPPSVSAPPPAPGLDLRLGEQELADLALIVELMQQRAPATVVRRDAPMTLRLARSGAFEARVHEALSRRGTPGDGPVLIFQAKADAVGAFHGNLTFVQGHVAFHPETANAAQFGVLSGTLGRQDRDGSVLGYAVLPAHVDLTRPVDIYWNDLQTTATLVR